MNTLKISTAKQAEQANDYFNGFHDANVQRIELALHSEQMKLFTSDGKSVVEEVVTGKDVAIDLLHDNYDYPNQPKDRLLKINALNCTEVNDLLSRFIGDDVFDMRFIAGDRGIACELIYHAPDVGVVRSLDNGTKITLFCAESIQISESLRPDPAHSPVRQ